MEAAENEEEFSPDGKRAELKGRNRKWDRKNPREQPYRTSRVENRKK